MAGCCSVTEMCSLPVLTAARPPFCAFIIWGSFHSHACQNCFLIGLPFTFVLSDHSWNHAVMNTYWRQCRNSKPNETRYILSKWRNSLWYQNQWNRCIQGTEQLSNTDVMFCFQYDYDTLPQSSPLHFIIHLAATRAGTGSSYQDHQTNEENQCNQSNHHTCSHKQCLSGYPFDLCKRPLLWGLGRVALSIWYINVHVSHINLIESSLVKKTPLCLEPVFVKPNKVTQSGMGGIRPVWAAESLLAMQLVMARQKEWSF